MNKGWTRFQRPMLIRRIFGGLALVLVCALLGALAGCGGTAQQGAGDGTGGTDGAGGVSQAAAALRVGKSASDAGDAAAGGLSDMPDGNADPGSLSDMPDGNASAGGLSDMPDGDEPYWGDPAWEEAENDGTLVFLRQGMAGTEDVCAVARLGYAEDIETGLAGLMEHPGYASWAFLAKLPPEAYVEHEGREVFLVVPRDRHAKVTVYTWTVDEANGYEGKRGKALYSSEYGHPILLRGNDTDYYPNLELVIQSEDGSVLEYNPWMNLHDDILQTPSEGPGVWDCTAYGTRQYTEERVLTMEECMGSWASSYYDENMLLMSCYLEFQEDGGMMFGFGRLKEEGEYIYYTTHYEGSWWWCQTIEEAVEFGMTLKSDESGENFPKEFRGVYRLTDGGDPDSGILYVHHLDGDSLSMDGRTGDDYAFYRTVG